MRRVYLCRVYRDVRRARERITLFPTWGGLLLLILVYLIRKRVTTLRIWVYDFKNVTRRTYHHWLLNIFTTVHKGTESPMVNCFISIYLLYLHERRTRRMADCRNPRDGTRRLGKGQCHAALLYSFDLSNLYKKNLRMKYDTNISSWVVSINNHTHFKSF